MRIGELVAATVPGDPVVIRGNAAQLDAKIQESDRILGTMSFALDLEQRRDGVTDTPHWREGATLRDRWQEERERAVERRDALLEYADALERHQSRLAEIVEWTSTAIGEASLLPIDCAAASAMPWWTRTRVTQSLALRLGHAIPDLPRMAAAASPALIDAIYLVLSEWNRNGVEGAVTHLVDGAEVTATAPLASYLDAGTTIAAESTVMAAELPSLGAAEAVLWAAERVAVLITATPNTLCLCQVWTTADGGVLAEGDGLNLCLSEMTSAEATGRLLEVAEFSPSAVSGDSLLLPKEWVERLVSADAIVRTRAARHLAQLSAEPVLAAALADDSWRMVALSNAFTDGAVADGIAGLWLAAADRLWRILPDADAAQLCPVNAEEAVERFCVITEAERCAG